MKAPLFTLAVICATLAVGPSVSAQTPDRPPTIHNVTLDATAGVLTITGVGFGRDPVVTVDGQPAVVLPGGSETRLNVQAPTAVLTTPGTYRLTVLDPVRQSGDGFVVASPMGIFVSGRGAGTDGSGGDAPTAATLSEVVAAAERPASALRPAAGVSPNLIEHLTNTAVGLNAFASNTTGAFDTASGAEALYANTTGVDNTASGFRALYSNTTGVDNTASGFRTLYSNTSGFNNTASGAAALNANTTGSYNTASGFQALRSSTTGIQNTAIGALALFANGTGSYNTASGFEALTNTTSDANTATGFRALYLNTTGAENTASGHGALFSNTTGYDNTASGFAALFSNTTGTHNTAIGRRAGLNATTGSYNVFLGADVTGTAADTNTIRIGVPFSSGAGQNQTFIAGIRGTTVTGGEAVLIDASGKLGSGLAPVGANTVGSAQVIDDSLAASDLAPNAVGTSELAADAVTAAKVAFPYAASTSEGGAASDVTCVGCVSATEVSFSFASLAANTFVGTQTIGAGHLDLAPSTTTGGNITKNGVPFLHNVGTQNTFLGVNAGNLTMTGANNTANGVDALFSNTTANFNTAAGHRALFSNTAGQVNTASGASALTRNTTGSGNTAAGAGALFNNTTGQQNVAVGYNAGYFATTGSYNLFVGAGGTAADANTIRIGVPYSNGVGQSQTFIAGIYGAQLTAPATAVYIDANGQLGTMQPPSPPPTFGGGGVGSSGPPTLPQQVQAQQATIAELQTIIADLRARLARLEAVGARRR